MPYVKIWIHAVWAVKNRQKILKKDIRNKLFSHIHYNSLEKGIFMDCVNGHLEHVHCLFRLKSDQKIQDVMRFVKGESSHWAGKMQLTTPKLTWQDEYFAVSVSESQVPSIREYIKQQEMHHKNKTFGDEYQEFIHKYGFQVLKDGPF